MLKDREDALIGAVLGALFGAILMFITFSENREARPIIWVGIISAGIGAIGGRIGGSRAKQKWGAVVGGFIGAVLGLLVFITFGIFTMVG